MWLHSGPVLQDTKMPQNPPETYWQGQVEEMRHLRTQHQGSDRPSFWLIMAIINKSNSIISAGLLFGEKHVNTTDSPFYRNKKEQQLEKSNPWSKMLRRRRGGMRDEKEPSVSVILPCWSSLPQPCGFYFLVLIRASPPNFFSCGCQSEVNEYWEWTEKNFQDVF